MTEAEELDYYKGLCDRLRQQLGVDSDGEILNAVIKLSHDHDKLTEFFDALPICIDEIL